MMFDVKPNNAKNQQEMRQKVWQDNQDIAGQKKEQDEFFVGIGLGQGNKKAEVEGGAKAPRPKKEDVFDMIGNYYVESREKEENKFESAEMPEQYIKNDYLSPAQRAKQNISNSIGEKAGVTEDVFDLIEKEYEASLLREKENEEKRWEGFGSFFAKPDSIITQNQANKFSLGNRSKTAEEALWNRSDAMARIAGVKQSVLDEIKTEAREKNYTKAYQKSFNSGIRNADANITGGLDLLLGKPLQAIGWENNPISSINDYYQTKKNESFAELYEEVEKAGGGKPLEFTTQLNANLVSLIPNLIITYMTAGASSSAQAVGGVKSALNSTLSNPMFLYSFETNLYPEYEYALQNGATENEAMLMAPFAALMDAGIEVGGGIETVPAVLKNQGTRNKILSEWWKIAKAEGNEEILQSISSELLQKVMFDGDKKWISFDENQNAVLNAPALAKNWGMGALAGGILGSPVAMGTMVLKNGQLEPGFLKADRYDTVIDNINSLNPNGYIEIGTINKDSVLNRIGLEDGKVYMDVSKINKSIISHSDLNTKIIMRNLPYMLNDPTIITESDRENTVCLYSESYMNNSPIMVGIIVTIDRSGNATVNKIRTIHARRDKSTNITDKNILYLHPDKKRTLNWFQALGTDVPSGGTVLGFIRRITLKGKVVNVKENEIMKKNSFNTKN